MNGWKKHRKTLGKGIKKPKESGQHRIVSLEEMNVKIHNFPLCSKLY